MEKNHHKRFNEALLKHIIPQLREDILALDLGHANSTLNFLEKCVKINIELLEQEVV